MSITERIRKWYHGEYIPWENSAGDHVFIVGGYHSISRSAKIARAVVQHVQKEWKWWIATIIAVVGVCAWWLSAHFERQSREADIARSVAITVANDLRISAGVSQASRAPLIEGKVGSATGSFGAIYSPTVDLPGSGETSILRPSSLSALDEYKRRLSECAKHRQNLIDAWKISTPPPNASALLMIYCVSLDSVVRTGFALLDAIERDYPATKGTITRPEGYRPIDEDLQQIQKALLEPTE